MSENNKSECLCGSAGYMVLSCSGACDLGLVSDMVARKLRDNKVRAMNCLAVVAAGIEKSIADFKTKNVLMIDGCPIDCGKKILDQAGFADYKYVRITDFGYKKGSTPVTQQVIEDVYDKVETIY